MGNAIANQLSPSQVSGRLVTWHRVMEEAGLSYDALQVPIDDPEMRGRLVRFWMNGGYNVISSGYDRARLILGRDLITAEEISQAMGGGVYYSDEQLKMFADTLPGETDLIGLRDNGFMLVAGPPSPMSLLDIRAAKSEYFCAKSGGWYGEDVEKFSRDDKALTIWLGLRKVPAHDSTGRNWDEQNSLLAKVERVPNSAEVAWGVTTYKAVRNVYLFKNIYIRTSSVSSDDGRVIIGDFGQGGLYVYYDWDSFRVSSLGLASARIFNPS